MEVREKAHPSDKFNLVYLIFLLHGIGVLLPWNMFITATSYFIDHKLKDFVYSTTVATFNVTTPSPFETTYPNITYPNTTYPNTTYDTTTLAPSKGKYNDYQNGFLTATGIAANVPNVLFNAINLFIQTKGGNMKNRITAMILVECMVFLVTIVMVFIDTSNHIGAFYYFTLLTITIMNMANGVYQSSVYGLVASLPQSYSGAIILGNNLCGTLVSIISIISKAASAEPERSAVVYFCSTLAVLILCLITIHLLKINRYFRHFEELSISTESETSAPKRKTKSLERQSLNEKSSLSEKPSLTGKSSLDGEIEDSQDGESHPVELSAFVIGLKQKWNTYMEVMKNIWPLCLDIFLIFYVTLSVFPAITASVEASGPMSGLGSYFQDVTCFLCFNFFAALGSYLARFFQYPESKYLWIPTVARFLFLPFFLMCNYKPAARSFRVLIPNDVIYTIGVALLGLSSGYFSALVFMYLPDTDNPEHGASASMLTAFFLVLGVFLGVSSSGLLRIIAT